MLTDVIENAKYEKEQLIEQGRLEGELKGKLEGKLEERLEIARLMLQEGASIDFIMKVTKLTKEQIEEINID